MSKTIKYPAESYEAILNAVKKAHELYGDSISIREINRCLCEGSPFVKVSRQLIYRTIVRNGYHRDKSQYTYHQRYCKIA